MSGVFTRTVNRDNMYYWSATCTDYVSYENPSGGGGYFTRVVCSHLKENAYKKQIPLKCLNVDSNNSF